MNYTTKDTGERAQFESGMQRDIQTGKPNFYLCLPKNVRYEEQMLTRWAALMARGAEKYDERNWEKATGKEELERFKSSAFRHFIQWINGEIDEDHAAAVFFNITGAEYVKDFLGGGQVASLEAADVRNSVWDMLRAVKKKPTKEDWQKLHTLILGLPHIYRKKDGSEKQNNQ